MQIPEYTNNFIFYNSEDGQIKIQVIIDDKNETIWASQKAIAEIFGVNKSGVSRHLKNIFDNGELDKNSVVAFFATTGDDKKTYQVEYYNLDVIISVGYRVNSLQATTFRKWATNTLREYLIKGFALDDQRLKQGNQLFDKDYFAELLERIREIRSSERRFYQKVTDIYMTSIDYDVNSPITKDFFASVQNKLHWAITHQTASEIIVNRADIEKPNMGLTTWKKQKENGKILKSDVSIAKNYLNEKELSELNRIVSMFLDYAENIAEKKERKLTMRDWVEKINSFLQFNEYDLLNHLGKVSKEVAQKTAEDIYTKFRVIQDKNYQSDFDKFIKGLKEK